MESQRLTGRITTTGILPSLTLLLLQPGSLTYLRLFLLLACDSIWSSHTSVEGLKPCLWLHYGPEHEEKANASAFHETFPRALLAFNLSDPRILCHCTVLQELILMLCLPSSQLALPFLPLSCFSWGGHFSLQLVPVGLLLLKSLLLAFERAIQAKPIHAGA